MSLLLLLVLLLLVLKQGLVVYRSTGPQYIRMCEFCFAEKNLRIRSLQVLLLPATNAAPWLGAKH